MPSLPFAGAPHGAASDGAWRGAGHALAAADLRDRHVENVTMIAVARLGQLGRGWIGMTIVATTMADRKDVPAAAVRR